MEVRNLLISLEKKGIPHFIVKSHIFAMFDDEEYRTEYHIYHLPHESIGKWNVKCSIYEKLRLKIFSREEMRYFHKNLDKYEQVRNGKDGKMLNPKDGKIWVNKSVGFNPKTVRRKTTSNGNETFNGPNLFSNNRF